MSENAGNHKNKYLSYLLRLLVASIALYLTFRNVNLKEVGGLLLRLNLLNFCFALLLSIVSGVIIALRWNVFLLAQSIHISALAAIKLTFLGFFYNNFLPSSVGGDVIRAWYVTKHTHKRLEAALSVFIDRIVGLICLVLMAFGCYWLFPAEQRRNGLAIKYNFNLGNYLSKYETILYVIISAIVLVVVIVLTIPKLRQAARKKFDYIFAKLLKVTKAAFEASWFYCRKPMVLLTVSVLTFIAQSMVVIAFWLVGKDLGVDASLKYYFVFFPILWVVGALPISIGGLGVVEGGVKAMFTTFAGVPDIPASALAICQRLIVWITSLPGVIIHLSGSHLPDKEFFIDCEGSAN